MTLALVTEWIVLGVTLAELQANLLDIHNQRLQGMNENNVDFASTKFPH